MALPKKPVAGILEAAAPVSLIQINEAW